MRYRGRIGLSRINTRKCATVCHCDLACTGGVGLCLHTCITVLACMSCHCSPPTTHAHTHTHTHTHTLLSRSYTLSASHRLQLSAAVAAGEWTVDKAYEVDKICAASDFINLMSYDLHGSWESFTGHNSPLYTEVEDVKDHC